MTDPFAAPAPVASDFASLQSFDGRLVIIEPTRLETNIPNPEDPSKVMDRITANITTVDGQGAVPQYARRVATGKTFEGPRHEGVWLSQDRVVKALMNPDVPGVPLKMVLARVGTWKGGPAGRGNPWELKPFTDADAVTARNFLANRTVGAAAQPQAQEAPPNPFGN